MSEKKAKGERKTIKEELAEGKMIVTVIFSPEGSVSFEHDRRLQGAQIVSGLRSVIDTILIQAAVSAMENKMGQMAMLAKKGLLKQ